jgi:hypothetical protein
MLTNLTRWLTRPSLRRMDALGQQVEAGLDQGRALGRRFDALEPQIAALSESTALLLARIDELDQRMKAMSDVQLRINKRVNRVQRDMRVPRELKNTEAETEFLQLANELNGHGRTSLDPARLYVLWQAAKNTRHLAGACAEVGAYRGGSAYFIASAIDHFGPAQSPLHVVDTFAGHPADRVTARDTFQPPGKFSDTSFEEVRRYLSRFPTVEVHRGEFAATASELPDCAYRLVHVDTDLFQPTLDSLRYFGPRLCRDGIIVIDDYGSEKCQPVVDAVRAYTEQDDAWHTWDMATEQLVLVRR